MTNKHRASSSRAKHRGESKIGKKPLVAGATAMALGAATLWGSSNAHELVSAAVYQLDELNAAHGDHIPVGPERLPKTLPPAVAKAISKSTVKVSFSEHNDSTGDTVTGTGVAIRGGFLSAAHVGFTEKPAPEVCTNGHVAYRNYDQEYDASIDERAAMPDKRHDLAFLQGQPEGSKPSLASIATRPFSEGEVLYAASFQPVDDKQGRGPWELQTRNIPDRYQYTMPVVAAAISLGVDRQGDNVFLTNVKSYGQGAAKGVAEVDHGASGGPLFNEEGQLVGIVKSIALDNNDHPLKTVSTIEHKLGLTLEGANPNNEYQVMKATTITNELVDRLAQTAKPCVTAE